MAKKVNFNLLTSPDKENALILLRLNYKARRFQISTGLTIPLKYWNKKTQRCKETAAFPYAKPINERLNSLAADTLGLFYQYTAKGIVPTAEQFKKDFLAITTHVQEEAPELLAFIRQFIDERKAMKKPKGTIQNYSNCLMHLKAYQSARNKALTFANIGQQFLSDFTAYLFAQRLADSFVHKLIATLKTFVREADRRGIYEGCPLLKAKVEVRKLVKDTVYLNEGELRLLFNMKLEGRLANVRDLLLLGCFTGLRFSDYTQIKPENIQPQEHLGKTVKCLVMTTQKTKQKVILPLTNPMLRAILERHGWKAPKAISPQKFNDYAKELCREAGLTQAIEINEFRAGRQEKRTVQKWELISSHTGRRSFATNAVKSGLPATQVMKFTGHSTMAAFLKYIRATTEEAAVHYSEHEFFTGKPSLKVVS